MGEREPGLGLRPDRGRQGQSRVCDFRPGQQLLVHRPCDVGQDARQIDGLFAPIPCGGDRPKKCTGTPPAPLCWPWTTDRPTSRFSFLTAPRRSHTLCGVLYEGRVDAQKILKGFSDWTDGVLQLIEGFLPETAWLSDAGIVGNSATNV
jgi:hypothetical protein